MFRNKITKLVYPCIKVGCKRVFIVRTCLRDTIDADELRQVGVFCMNTNNLGLQPGPQHDQTAYKQNQYNIANTICIIFGI